MAEKLNIFFHELSSALFTLNTRRMYEAACAL